MNSRTLVAHTARRWMVALGLLAAVTLAHAANLPAGWAARAEGNGTTFAPVRMNQGEKFEIWVASTLFDAPQGASQLPQIRQQAGVQGGQCQPPQTSPEGVATQDCMDGNVALQYMLLPSAAGAGKVQLLRIRAAGGDEALARYGNDFQQVLQIVMQGQAQAQPQQQTQPQPQAQPQPAAAHAGGVPDGWKVYGANKGVAFAPVKLNRGEKLEIWVANEWFKMERGVNWASQLPRIRQQARTLGNENCQPPTLESGVAMQTCVAGEEAAQYTLLPTGKSGTYARLMRLQAAGAGVLERHRDGIQQAMEIMRKGNAQDVLKSQEKQEREHIARAIRTAPGQGVRDGDIAAVFVTSNPRAQSSGETVYRTEHTTWLLLKDGTGYNNTIPPDELNVNVSRQLQPQRWVQWRKPWLGGNYEIRGPNDNGWRPLPEGWIAQPARPGERLNGVYARTDYYGSMYTTIRTSRNTWTFSGDGTYQTSYSGSSNYYDSLNHVSITTSRTSNSSGTRASTGLSNTAALHNSSGGATVAANSKTSKDDGASRRGRYRLNGWVLELERDDGQTERLFVTFRDGQRDMVDVSSDWFEVEKKKK